MKSIFKNTSLFDIAFRMLLIILPFTTILTVFSREKLGIPGFGFYKELLILSMFMILVWEYLQKRIQIKYSWIDGLILAYIVTLTVISTWTTGVQGILYGGRYDFGFLFGFLILYHGYSLLGKNMGFYLKIFLFSGGTMLFLSGLLKWPLTEDILLWFGYCGNPSNWQACNGVPPIFHGVDGANVRRFQGLLDGPNTMGAFLLLFGGIFTYYMRMRREWYFTTGIILTGIFGMVFYTYSRSALLGAVVAIIIPTIWSIGFIYKKYKKQFIITVCIGVILGGFMVIKYSGSAGAILGRAGSTKGHYERMMTSIGRFVDHPIGQGLGSAGPAYRYIIPVDASNMEEKDRFYIPESWYIQQFVEGGIVGGIFFLGIMFILFILLMSESPILGGMFAGIGVMNFFLHTFESSVLVLSLFMIIGLILGHKKIKEGGYN